MLDETKNFSLVVQKMQERKKIWYHISWLMKVWIFLSGFQQKERKVPLSFLLFMSHSMLGLLNLGFDACIQCFIGIRKM